MFIRKLLDLCFSERELSYLDDLMPEWKKKKLDDDASKTMEEVVTTEELKSKEVWLRFFIYFLQLDVFACVLQESLVMLNLNTDNTTTVQIPMESKPVQRVHDPR